MNTTDPTKPSACIIVGDLSLDVVCSVTDSSALDDLIAGHDATEDTGSAVTLGGSAWLFAEALRSSSGAVEPIIIAPVGSDQAARFIQAELAKRGLVTTGILATNTPTSVCLMIYFSQNQRLMTFPSTTAPRVNDAEEYADILNAIGSEFQLHCAWISGHSLRRATPERLDALRSICATAKRDGGRVVFDLVPHAFKAAIGDVSIIEQLGWIDGIVGEYPTFEDLGLTTPLVHKSSREQMTYAATQVSERYRLCVVQGKMNDNTFGQAVAMDGTLIHWQDTRLTSLTLRGLGDRLAVDALLRASYL